MLVTVNGEPQELKKRITIEELIDSLGLDSRKVAVECNLEIIPKSNYSKTFLNDKDRLEIVHFIGGGMNNQISELQSDSWEIAGKKFNSRLIVGTGKYKDFEETSKAIALSGAEIVTVAVRRVNITDKNTPMLVDYLDPKVYTYLPNTAFCYTADEAVRTLRLAREAGGWSLVKLEVLGDDKTLYPNMHETLKALKKTVIWLVKNQSEDGSWGHWRPDTLLKSENMIRGQVFDSHKYVCTNTVFTLNFEHL